MSLLEKLKAQPTRMKFLLLAIALSVSTNIASEIVKNSQQRNLFSLMAECLDEDAVAYQANPENRGYAVCDQSAIYRNKDAIQLSPIQKKILDAPTHSRLMANLEMLSAVVLILSAMPFAWRFFLARLKEVANAVRGNS